MTKVRGFEEVKESARKHGQKVKAHGQEILLHPRTILPQRADKGSAGYDFATPVAFQLTPGESKVVFTNVKAYMQEDEVLKVFIRSSLAVKKGVVLANGTGIIDASYYNNPSNDGNIGLALLNTTGQSVSFEAGERIGQGIFVKYLEADSDETLHESREGGFGSSGQ